MLHGGHGGVAQGDGGGWGWVLPEVHYHLHCLQSVKLYTANDLVLTKTKKLRFRSVR